MRPSQDEYGNAREAFDLGKVKTRTDFPGERGGGGGAFESQPSFYCAQKVSVLNIAMYGQQSPASVKQCVGIWEMQYVPDFHDVEGFDHAQQVLL